jgi:hypothetical protein
LQIDPVGTVLAMGAVISFILALQYGGVSKPWNSSTVIGLLVGFVAIAVTFSVWEYFQGERAAVSRRLLSDRNVWVNSLYTMFFAGSYFIIIYYLPYYFQSIDNVSPTTSGIRNLPLIIAVSISVIVSSGSVSLTGVAIPLLIAGSVLSTVGAGLLYTLDIGTGTGKWIGYQILAGVGWGMGFQIPIIVGQGTADPSDVAPVTAIILCMLHPTPPPRVQINGLTAHLSLPNCRCCFLLGRCTSRFRQPDHPHASHECTGRRPSHCDCDWCNPATVCFRR